MTERLFNSQQIALLTEVQDQLIPAEDGMPAAGSVGGAGIVEGFLRERAELYEAVTLALAVIEKASGDVSFLQRTPDERVEILKLAEVSAPESFAELVRQTYNAYYTQAEIQAKLGVDAPPQPDGFQLPNFDASRLVRVRAMGKLWRDA
jgi:hypothetical protein